MKESFETQKFCILPWVHARLNQNAQVLPCCRIESVYSYGNLRTQSFAEIWKSTAIDQIREAMLKGEQLPMCKGCHQIENDGGRSLRTQMNHIFQEEISDLKKSYENGKAYQSEIKFLDVRFSNSCNFSCRSCNHENSTSWHKDAYEFTNKPETRLIQFDEVEKATHQIIDQDQGHLKRIYFAGGEPLIQKQHYKILEKLIDMNRLDIELMYNTNLSTLEFQHWKAIDLWNKFKRVSISASLDGVLEKAEYIRHGTQWKDVETNYLRILKEVPHAELSIAPTVSLYNAFHLPEAIKYFVQQKMIFSPEQLSLNILTQPHYLSIALFNDEERSELDKKYDQFLSNFKENFSNEIYKKIFFELNRVKVFLSKNKSNDRKSFRNFSIKVDQLRNENTLKNFPELLSFIVNN